MIAGFRLFLFVFIASCASAQAQSTGATPANAGAPPPAATVPPDPTIPTDPAVPMLKKAYALISGPKKDFDGALTMVDEAVKDNPKSFAAFTLRGMIYSQKKQWTSAEADFDAALALDPNNIVVKFNLAELKFLQKNYAEARTRFETLMHDKAMGEFAGYKVFLCNLFGGNEIAAKTTLDSWDEETGPSFFWASAAWDLVHKNTDDARGWITSAIRIFPPNENKFYAQSLLDLGYLPLPPVPDQAAAPGV